MPTVADPPGNSQAPTVKHGLADALRSVQESIVRPITRWANTHIGRVNRCYLVLGEGGPELYVVSQQPECDEEVTEALSELVIALNHVDVPLFGMLVADGPLETLAGQFPLRRAMMIQPVAGE